MWSFLRRPIVLFTPDVPRTPSAPDVAPKPVLSRRQEVHLRRQRADKLARNAPKAPSSKE